MDLSQLVFNDPIKLEMALTHRSHAHQEGLGVQFNNERLEFLGDALINQVASRLLYEVYPEENEGFLSRRRALMVNEASLAEIAIELGVRERLRLGRGEVKTGGADRPRLLSSALEAIAGALWLDQGFEHAEGWVRQWLKGPLEKSHINRDYKTALQERVHREEHGTLEYVLVEADGPEHDKVFSVTARAGLRGELIESAGKGRSKKLAEQDAARGLLEALEQKGWM